MYLTVTPLILKQSKLPVSSPKYGTTFLLFSHATGFQTRDEIGGRVVSFNGDDCDFSEVAWIGSLNLETKCNKILPWQDADQWPAVSSVFFLSAKPYERSNPNNTMPTVFEDVDWSHGCRGAAACWWLVRVKFSWTNKSVQFSTALLGCSLLTVRWKIIRWKHGMKVEKTWRNTTSH